MCLLLACTPRRLLNVLSLSIKVRACKRSQSCVAAGTWWILCLLLAWTRCRLVHCCCKYKYWKRKTIYKYLERNYWRCMVVLCVYQSLVKLLPEKNVVLQPALKILLYLLLAWLLAGWSTLPYMFGATKHTTHQTSELGGGVGLGFGV